MNKYGWCHVTLDITLEGEPVRWDDLSDITQEHIAAKILEGYLSIEIIEEEEEEEESDDYHTQHP